MDRGVIHLGGGGEKLRIGVHVIPLLRLEKRRKLRNGEAFRLLPFAGIIQIRFEGVSHPTA
jgi:hypothetical protein